MRKAPRRYSSVIFPKKLFTPETVPHIMAFAFRYIPITPIAAKENTAKFITGRPPRFSFLFINLYTPFVRNPVVYIFPDKKEIIYTIDKIGRLL